MNLPIINKVLVAGLVALSWSNSGHAVTAGIDSFSAAGFTDSFSNGLTPTQEGGAYSVFGTFPNDVETGGKLMLDSAWGSLTTSALGQPREALIVSRTGLGLNTTPVSSFSVSGIFDLNLGSGSLTSNYGVRERAVVNNVTAAVLSMDVTYNGSATFISLVYQNFLNGSINTIASVLADGQQSQIELSLFNENSSNIHGRYRYTNFGSSNGWVELGTFDPVDNVALVPQFYAAAAVPEPEPIALFSLGLAVIAGRVRRKRS